MLTPGKAIFHPNFSGKKKGLKNPSPCEDPLPSAPRGGLPVGRSGRRNGHSWGSNKEAMGTAARVMGPSSLSEPMEVPMAQTDDLSRCLAAFDQNSTLVVVVELSQASGL